MNNFFIETFCLVSAEEQLIIASNYQTPTIEIYNPNQLTESATQIMSETNGGYYS